MFEKESEEWADKGLAEKYKTLEWYARKNNFQKGAEFGYNKANEWHFVKDELPNNTNICLIYLGRWYNPTTGWYDNNAWCFEDDRKAGLWQDAVIAWKELVLPELPKESE